MDLEELIGKESYIFWDEKSIQTIKENNEKRKKGIVSKYEGVLKSKNGKLIPVFCSGIPIPCGGTIGIMTNLSEVKSLKEDQKEMKELNEVKDEFISIIGHELRTPLTSIKGYSDMLLRGLMGELNKEQIAALNSVNSSTLRLIELVNDILSISKINSGKMQYYINVLPIKPILENVYKDIKIETYLRELNLELKIYGLDGINIKVDENKLKQVIINLLTNSIKFTNKGGNIIIEGKIVDNGNKVRVSVIDSGEGIPEDKIEDLFNKFTQVEFVLQRKNTVGLGLSLVKNFIEKFGGKVFVESKIGEGSNFYFELDVEK